MKFKSQLLLLLVGIFTATFSSCSTDDEIPVPNVIRTGTFTVEDQVLVNNTLTIDSVNVTQQSWIVLHRDTGSGGPVGSEIISVPKLVQKGGRANVVISLKDSIEISDGETIWAVLYKDTNELGRYEFDGESGIDVPITNDAGEIVMDSFTVTVIPEPKGSLMVDDQALLDNIITLDSVMLDRGGFVVVHANNDEGGPVVPDIISEPLYLQEGTHTDVEIMLEESADVSVGDTLWVMLHTDTGIEEEYEFDGENGLDMPILDENGDIVMASFIITEVVMTPGTGNGAFADFDENSDGFLDEGEVSGIYENNFNVWDADNDGTLNEEEFLNTTFTNTDTNNDDQISQEEWDTGYAAFFGNWTEDDFATFDEDGDGMLDNDEWNNVFADSEWFETFDEDNNSMLTEEEWDTGLFNDWDTDDSGMIDENEFNVFNPFVSNWMTSNNTTAFADFDQNSDGMLDATEVSGIYENNFNEWDADNDGMLNKEEFLKTTFANTDADDDNGINQGEWNVGYDGFFGNWTGDDFATFDEDSDGILDNEEWNNVFTDSDWFETFDADTNSMLTEDEWDTGLFNDWDANDDDMIDEDEYNLFSPFVGSW